MEIFEHTNYGETYRPPKTRNIPSPQELNLPTDGWESEKIFFSGDTFFHQLCQDLRDAKESIYLETYIFFHDPLGKRIAEHLIAAAERGVDVRVIVDGFGSPFWKFLFQSKLKKSGVKCKIFHRIPFNIFLYFPMIFTNFYRLFAQLEKRNHRKMCIIDNKIGYVGSMNIAAYHMHEFVGENAWRDTGARVTGAAINILSEAFTASWHSSLFIMRDLIQRSSLVRVYNSRKKKRALYLDFLHRIDTAEKRIWLTTAYFVPTGSLLQKLCNAAARKVDIVILTTQKTDVFIIRWMRSAFYYGLLKAGAKIFEYKPSVLHAKSALIDDFAMLGSTNLNNRSFFHDLEIDIVLKKRDSLKQFETQFLGDLKKSQEIRINEWRNPVFFERLLAKIALLFRHWL